MPIWALSGTDFRDLLRWLAGAACFDIGYGSRCGGFAGQGSSGLEQMLPAALSNMIELLGLERFREENPLA
jgi:hypothetical protein